MATKSGFRPKTAAEMAELRKMASTPEAKAKARATRARNKALKAAGIGGVAAAMAHAHESGELGRAIAAGLKKTARKPRKAKISMTSALGGLPSAWAEPLVTHEAITGVVSAKPKKATKKKPAKKAKPKKTASKSGSAPKRKKTASPKKKAASKRKAAAKKPKKVAKKKAAKKVTRKKATKKAKKPKKKASKKGKRKSAHLVPGHMSVVVKGKKRCRRCGKPHTESQHWSHAVEGPRAKPRLNRHKHSYRHSPHRKFKHKRSLFAFLGDG